MADEAGPGDGLAPSLRVLPPARRLDGDFSASAHLIEFAVATASGLTAAAAIELVKAAVEARAGRYSRKVHVTVKARAPEDQTIRVVVELEHDD